MERIITAKINHELSIQKSKVIILIGQRQVGKTYALRTFQESFPSSLYFDFEDINNQELFKPAVNVIESVIGHKDHPRLLLLDEIQYLDRSGAILKLLYDHFPQTKIIATGSASFLLLKNIGDSLYGRSLIFHLHPLTFREIVTDVSNLAYRLGGYHKMLNKPTIEAQIDNLMVYGSLPDIYLESDRNRKKAILKGYVNSLLFKDVLEIEEIRKPQIFKQLLGLLALQVGREINPNELATQLEITRKTVIEYIGLYEKFKIIHTLKAFNNNQRREIKKGFKVYFTDLGIRNAVIDNFVQASGRNDLGALFENLVVNTFRQNIDYYTLPYQLFFWRTSAGSEIDLVLWCSENNQLTPLEIKYNKLKSPSRSLKNIYPDRVTQDYCVNKHNFWQFI
jgi:uncharacterized protein